MSSVELCSEWATMSSADDAAFIPVKSIVSPSRPIGGCSTDDVTASVVGVLIRKSSPMLYFINSDVFFCEVVFIKLVVCVEARWMTGPCS